MCSEDFTTLRKLYSRSDVKRQQQKQESGHKENSATEKMIKSQLFLRQGFFLPEGVFFVAQLVTTTQLFIWLLSVQSEKQQPEVGYKSPHGLTVLPIGEVTVCLKPRSSILNPPLKRYGFLALIREFENFHRGIL